MNASTTTLDDCLQDLQAARYSEPELAEIRALLEKFCDTVIIYLARFLERTRIYRKAPPFERVMRALYGYDRLVWRYSSPGQYGDPDDVGVDGNGECIGTRNADAIARVYQALELPLAKGIH